MVVQLSEEKTGIEEWEPDNFQKPSERKSNDHSKEDFRVDMRKTFL